ncbi:aminotransferase class IV [Pseudomonas syringae group genomosp. 3]|uniref:aminotransferase class IV n=1 Tax=Pseudomonas syringae group genomosp. 3 TaxID=251701 RepID=UPI00217FBA4B|nr:aminotransferase class IV [Pseudomonas syringae group genomosp. 3]
MTLAREVLGLTVVERDISFSELYSIDECFLAGTGVEIVPVTQIDHYVLQDRTVGATTDALRSLYLQTVKGSNSQYAHWLSPLFSRSPGDS